MVNKFTPNNKNIWVAAGDGDLDQVKYLVQAKGISPNTPDEYSYTPMHAAASYGHIDVLEYLISKGGDVNMIDNENETPLYVVETPQVAKWLVDHGADSQWKNADRLKPADVLREDFPEIADWLASLAPPPEPEPENVDPSTSEPTNESSTSTSAPIPTAGSSTTDPAISTGTSLPSTAQPSAYATDQSADALTSQLLARVHEIMARAEAEGKDLEAELDHLVGDTVIEGLMKGINLREEAEEDAEREAGGDEEGGGARRAPMGEEEGANKRSRVDE